jgi:hypothetical protein
MNKKRISIVIAGYIKEKNNPDDIHAIATDDLKLKS